MENIDNSECKPIGLRRITVGSKVLFRGAYRPGSTYSKIVLMGKWLRECGFEHGEKLAVKVYPNRLVIEKEDPEELDTELLKRVLRANERELKKKLKLLLSAQIYERLLFEDGNILLRD